MASLSRLVHNLTVLHNFYGIMVPAADPASAAICGVWLNESLSFSLYFPIARSPWRIEPCVLVCLGLWLNGWHRKCLYELSCGACVCTHTLRRHQCYCAMHSTSRHSHSPSHFLLVVARARYISFTAVPRLANKKAAQTAHSHHTHTHMSSSSYIIVSNISKP